MDLFDKYRLDRTKIQVMTIEEMHADASDLEYWLGKSVDERIEALELLRQISYGYDPSTARLQRVLTVSRIEIR